MATAERPAKSRGQILVDVAYYAIWALGVGIILWFVVRWLMPFLLAFFAAALLQRPVRWLTARTGISRGFLAGMLVLAVVIAFAAAAGGIGWWLWQQATALLSDEAGIRALADRLASAWETVSQWGERRLQLLPDAVADVLRSLSDNISIGDWLPMAAGGLLRFVVGSFPTLIFAFFVWMIATVFITADYRRITAFLTSHLPPRVTAVVNDLRDLCGGTLKHTARAYLCLLGVTFLELCVGLWFLRVNGVVLLAALISLVDILPVLGVGSVLLPWAAVTALNGEGRFALCLVALYILITVVRNLLEPRLLSRRTGLPPLVTLMCLYAGWRLFRFWGLVLLPFAVTIAVGFYRRKQKSTPP